ncbi:MAG: hypothetical protein WCO31_01350 [Actinomycetes bacterium]
MDEPRKRHPLRRDLIALTSAYLLTRLIVSIGAGVTYNIWPVETGWDMHLLDTKLLRHDLFTSLFYLHSQPPGYNLASAFMLQLPSGTRVAVGYVISLILGLAVVWSSYLLMHDLHIRRWLTLTAVTLGLILSPVWLLYANYFFYSYWAAVLISVSLLCLLRYLRSQRPIYGITFFSVNALAILFDSQYQFPLLILGLGAIVLIARMPWKPVLLVALLPVLIVGGWYAKNLILFGTPSTSSWAGINISRIALFNSDPAQIRQLIAQHKLSAMALSPGFRPLNAEIWGYTGHKILYPHTGVKALDQIKKSNQQDNTNNKAYIEISRALLTEDLHSVTHTPGHYFHNVEKSVAIWFTPSDENFLLTGVASFLATPQLRAYNKFVKQNGLVTPAMQRYLNAYEGILGLRMAEGTPGSWVKIDTSVPTPRISQLSITEILMELAFLFGIPWIAWERRRDRKMLAFLAYLWLIAIMVFLESSLLDLGENDRFRFSLGTSLLIGGIVVIDRFLPRTRKTAARDGEQDLALPDKDAGLPLPS